MPEMPFKSSVPPAATVVILPLEVKATPPKPRAAEVPSWRVPVLIITLPLNVLAPVSNQIPAPTLASAVGAVALFTIVPAKVLALPE